MLTLTTTPRPATRQGRPVREHTGARTWCPDCGELRIRLRPVGGCDHPRALAVDAKTAEALADFRTQALAAGAPDFMPTAQALESGRTSFVADMPDWRAEAIAQALDRVAPCDCDRWVDNQGLCHYCGRPVNRDTWHAYHGADADFDAAVAEWRRA